MAARMWLMRPVLVEPPLCDIVDLRTRLTIDDVADLHELLDLKDALAMRAQEVSQREARRR